MHYVFYAAWIVFVVIIDSKLLIGGPISIKERMAELKSDLAYASPDGGKAAIAIAPSEYVVVSIGLAAARFDDRDARQQAPIEVVIVGHVNEILGHVLDRTVESGHELPEAEGTRIPHFGEVLRIGWFCGDYVFQLQGNRGCKEGCY